MNENGKVHVVFLSFFLSVCCEKDTSKYLKMNLKNMCLIEEKTEISLREINVDMLQSGLEYCTRLKLDSCPVL